MRILTTRKRKAVLCLALLLLLLALSARAWKPDTPRASGPPEEAESPLPGVRLMY